MQTRITKEGSALIDLIFTNNEQVIARVNVFALSLSDHDGVGCVKKVNHLKFTPRIITYRNFSRYSLEHLNRDILNHD